MGLPIITKTEYKTYAGLTTPNHDAEIETLIPKVSAFVKNYCRTSFIDYVGDPKVEHFNGGTNFFILKETPILQIQSFEASYDYGKTYSTLVEYTDWALDNSIQCVRSISTAGFPERINGYKVTYTAGYETIPEDLKLAVCDMITYYRQNDSAVHSSKLPGSNAVPIEYITSSSLPANIRRVLDLCASDYV